MSVLTNLYVRDKYSGTIHRIGNDPHDMLYVDNYGTVHYQNLQNGDGCIGAMSVNRKTLGEEHPEIDWRNRATEYVDGYEFVPNLSDEGYPIDPTEEKEE